VDGRRAPAADRDEIAGGAEHAATSRWRHLPSPGRIGGAAGAALVVLLALAAGPDLLSGAGTTAEPPAGRGNGPVSQDARSWTGEADREHGNRFVQSRTRLLRLPA
jgi:hypothetical protein